MKDEIMEQPIFIVGVPRSGTTLVRMILNAHSRIGIAPETHFFRLFWRARHKYGDLRNDDYLQKLWDDLFRSKSFWDFRFVDVEKIHNKIFDCERSYKAIFGTLLQEYAKQNNKVRWGEKTPNHLKFARIILDFYPNAQIIHVIRDPRDVALSLKKVPWGSNHVFSSARLWNRYMETPRKHKLTNRGSYLEIRYEELVTRPKEMVNLLCSFIHEEPEDEMYEFYRYSGRYIERAEPWKNGCLQPLTSSNIGKWICELSKWEVDQIVLKCERRMIEKGYIRPQTDLSFAQRLFRSSKNLLFHCLWLGRGIFRRVKSSLKFLETGCTHAQ